MVDDFEQAYEDELDALLDMEEGKYAIRVVLIIVWSVHCTTVTRNNE